MSLYIRESYVNASEHCRIGDSGVYETSFDTTGELYRHCLQEFGRCTGKVYIDRHDGKGRRQIGWVFVKRVQTYLQETWVTVHTAQEKEDYEETCRRR